MKLRNKKLGVLLLVTVALGGLLYYWSEIQLAYYANKTDHIVISFQEPGPKWEHFQLDTRLSQQLTDVLQEKTTGYHPRMAVATATGIHFFDYDSNPIYGCRITDFRPIARQEMLEIARQGKTLTDAQIELINFEGDYSRGNSRRYID